MLYLDESTLVDPTKNVRGGNPVLFPQPGKLDGDAFEHRTPFGLVDAVIALARVGEPVADQQQWNFQLDQHANQARGEAITEPFLTRGLFRFSRHPSFFFEQAPWWCVYAFSVSASGKLLHFGLPGAVLRTLLFHGSSKFTESLSLAKHPSYAEFQHTTSRMIPMPPKAK